MSSDYGTSANFNICCGIMAFIHKLSIDRAYKCVLHDYCSNFQSYGALCALLRTGCAPITAFHPCGGSTRARAAKTRVTVAGEKWNVISPHTTPDSTVAAGGCVSEIGGLASSILRGGGRATLNHVRPFLCLKCEFLDSCCV